MDRAVLAINSSIWGWGKVVNISLSLSVKADQGWRDGIARRAPIGRFGERRRKRDASTFRRYHKPPFGGWKTSSLRGKRTRKKEEEVERQGRVRPGRKFVDMQNRFSSAVSSTPPPHPCNGEKLSHTSFSFLLSPFFPPSSSSSLSFFILSIYLSTRTRNKFME